MIPDARFRAQSNAFWAYVRSVSQSVGYTARGKGTIRVPSIDEIATAVNSLGLRTDPIVANSRPTSYGRLLLDYFAYRARVLNEHVEPRLMDADRARRLFNQLRDQYKPAAQDIPWNKQKGKKKTPSWFTASISMLIRAHLAGLACDFDPRSLIAFTNDGTLLRTMARRLDGAFPGVLNPVAIWEIKEYYHTTTFGSRVADGVYESLLDGMELKEMREHEKVDVRHYLMVDGYYTWWKRGRSYLCRIIDMLHMGYLDEVLFGYEILERLPGIAREWQAIARR